MTRRSFVSRSVAGSALTALSASRVLGANDRIGVGMLGCGKRNLLGRVLEVGGDANAEVRAVCDIWKQQRHAATAAVKASGGAVPEEIHAYEDLLARDDIDTIIIGTPDHQHCTQLIDAIHAGKDVYVEKPLAMDMGELTRAYDTVKASKHIVQMGTQVRSFPTSAAGREFVRQGKLGQVFKIEQARNSYKPYWYRYADRPIEEKDTDWKRFLMHRKPRPFTAQQYAGWFGYRDFSHGPHSNLAVHFMDLVHFVTDSGAPLSANTTAGSYRWNRDGFDAPDSVETVLEYPDKGFMMRYCSTFGVKGNSHLKFFGTRGMMDASRWGDPWIVTGESVEDEDRIPDRATLEAPKGDPHMLNFFECVRSRETPNAPIEAGYEHSIAVLLAEESYVRRRRVVYEPKKRRIHNG